MANLISQDATPLSQTFYYPIQIVRLEKVVSKSEEISSLPSILVIYEGHGFLTLKGEQYRLSRGCVVLWHNAKELDITTKLHAGLRGTLIQYYGLTNDQSEPSILKHSEPLSDCSYEIIRMASELEIISSESMNSNPFHFQKLFLELLEALYKEMEDRIRPSDSWLEQILNYMDRHFHEDLTREQMAQLAQVSPEHFSRAFRKKTGLTFSAYLALLRIRESQQKLLYNMPKLDNLAQEVGYKEGTYLSRKFKQLVGMSPSAFYNKKKRVVSLNTNHTACLLALGIIPELGVYSEWLDDVKQVSPVYKLNNYEQDTTSIYKNIAAVRPDLIINYNTAKNNKSLLSVAPVLEIPFMHISWREQFRLIADIVDKQQQVEAWFSQYDHLVSQCNEQLDRYLGIRGTAIVWEIGENTAYCINSSFGRGSQILYDDMGFHLPTSMLHHNIEKSGYIEIDIEAIANYPADHIFITALPLNKAGKKRVSHLFQSESWLKMEAVQRKQVYVINQSNMFYGYDPLSSKAQLYELMKVLTS
ncbi:ABC-type Fe3+-hydroxamate transport system substrate-binding protein [Lysinibacillus parviboronicapiens]|uniref:ABC-type Fe3+-hydroxamate transport system substrate-binding protein n=1 Tax=Lysinibacillus parviboronicapiens TaxID=436516 RepID=A0ABV2PM97_9BACI